MASPGDDASPFTRADRRREHTRSRLIAAGRDLITEGGVPGLRIASITERADVGRGSFYNHFTSRAALVDAIVTDSLEALGEAVIADVAADEDPIVAACRADRRFIRLAVETPDFARLLVNLDHGDEVFSAATIPYARIALQRGIDAGSFVIHDLDATLITLAGGAMGMIRAVLQGRAPAHADRRHAELMLLMLGVPADVAAKVSCMPLDRRRPAPGGEPRATRRRARSSRVTRSRS